VACKLPPINDIIARIRAADAAEWAARRRLLVAQHLPRRKMLLAHGAIPEAFEPDREVQADEWAA
jgi:hypothetical protein